MIYTEPQWSKFFLMITCICPQNPLQSQCIETRVWGDEIEELVDYAQEITSSLALANHPKIMEYLIWDGVPAPHKSAVRKWIYHPTIRNTN